MYQEYNIRYTAINTYNKEANGAYWRFLIIPEENPTQQLVSWDFSNSLHCPFQDSINGFGFRTVKVSPNEKFDTITFNAGFTIIKKEINPFDFPLSRDKKGNYAKLRELEFRVDFASFLGTTPLTKLPNATHGMFLFDTNKTIFKNVQRLNSFVYNLLRFTTNVTHVNTLLDEILEKKQGVCQDFAHLFCALARENAIPARYVSGYLHQGQDYFGHSQMHAWAEVYIPEIGWTAFDPTNNLMGNTDYIKVCHGRDYNDCTPLKGIVYTQGDHETTHSVTVHAQQQQ